MIRRSALLALGEGAAFRGVRALRARGRRRRVVSFVHENPEEFTDLVQIIGGETGMGRSIIEKDYWVTHTLWALSVSGLRTGRSTRCTGARESKSRTRPGRSVRGPPPSSAERRYLPGLEPSRLRGAQHTWASSTRPATVWE